MTISYSLPSEVKYCTECVISNQKPITLVETKHLNQGSKQTTFFDKDGVCDACRWSKIKKNGFEAFYVPTLNSKFVFIIENKNKMNLFHDLEYRNLKEF